VLEPLLHTANPANTDRRGAPRILARLTLMLLLSLCVAHSRSSSAGAADCPTRSIGVEPSRANGWVGVIFGHAAGQVFVAADTLVTSFKVWRVAIQDTNYAGMKLYITEADSTGYPHATSMILNGPTVYNYFGDGIHPIPFEFVFDPPFSLPHKGLFCFAVQAVPCEATWDILSSNLNPYPGGHAWDFGRSTCFLRTSPTPYPTVDLAFEIKFCDSATSVRETTWGSLKVIYRN
jgi:hypothetical protein